MQIAEFLSIREVPLESSNKHSNFPVEWRNSPQSFWYVDEFLKNDDEMTVQ